MTNSLQEDKKIPLSSQIKEIAKQYFSYKRILDDNSYQNDSELEICTSYIKKVNDAYEKLDGLDKKIINNDFFYEDYPFWWRRIYTPSTYYRLKNRSMKKFIELYEKS